MANRKKQLTTVLKLVVSALLIYFIFQKIPFATVWETVKQSSLGYLLLALLFFVVSKVLAAFRLNLYFHTIEVPLSQITNLKLALLGMFYNLFLPGGIGGDAYKGYLIQKHFEVKTKRVVAVLLLDRLSGLLLLFVYACLIALMAQEDFFAQYRILFGLALVTSIVVFALLNKKWFGYVYSVFWKSLGYSALVQLCQLVCVVFIMMALGITNSPLLYMFIFLVSSIVAVLPLTIGGIGSREVTFLYGAKWLGLDANISIGISMVFFIITALASLMGIVYHFKKPELHTVDQ